MACHEKMLINFVQMEGSCYSCCGRMDLMAPPPRLRQKLPKNLRSVPSRRRRVDCLKLLALEIMGQSLKKKGSASFSEYSRTERARERGTGERNDRRRRRSGAQKILVIEDYPSSSTTRRIYVVPPSLPPRSPLGMAVLCCPFCM